MDKYAPLMTEAQWKETERLNRIARDKIALDRMAQVRERNRKRAIQQALDTLVEAYKAGELRW